MSLGRKLAALLAVLIAASGAAGLAIATLRDLQPPPSFDAVDGLPSRAERLRFFDRHGRRLNVTFANRWNRADQVPLHELPELLVDAFVVSEDRRFFRHDGVDWQARFAALSQNVQAGRVIRGASTISEQVVRMLRPRPRTLWSRWLEGIDASRLERQEDKRSILEFYLNQVPYGGRRRGVVAASRYYFDRDLGTLNATELLALAVMVRAPRWFDPQRFPSRLQWAIGDLAARMQAAGKLDRPAPDVVAMELESGRRELQLNVAPFIRRVQAKLDQMEAAAHAGQVHTTLDLELQQHLHGVLEGALARHGGSNVKHGAALVVEHGGNDVRAWVVATRDGVETGTAIDSVGVRRQPGSTLKPFVYALALERGWSAATLIDDSPLHGAVGSGLHGYRNYSGRYYGPITLREALGNSLNVPAVRATRFVGVAGLLQRLRELGMSSLANADDFYGDGLALGNGEVSLEELVGAYSALARMGLATPLVMVDGARSEPRRRVFDQATASLIADILSDAKARTREFGGNSILNLPHQTAVKTGTSTDHRDAWAVGFDDRYTVGVWMGNLDYEPMQDVTGSSGPALVLRSAFAELGRYREPRPLYLSPRLERRRICVEDGRPVRPDGGYCAQRDEWFVDGQAGAAVAADNSAPRLVTPTDGLVLARDPRIPDDAEYFRFSRSGGASVETRWIVDGVRVGVTRGRHFDWRLEPGVHTAAAVVAGVRSAQATFEVR